MADGLKWQGEWATRREAKRKGYRLASWRKRRRVRKDPVVRAALVDYFARERASGGNLPGLTGEEILRFLDD